MDINGKLWCITAEGEVHPVVDEAPSKDLPGTPNIKITTAPRTNPDEMTIEKKLHYLRCFYLIQQKMTLGLVNLEGQIKLQTGSRRCKKLYSFVMEVGAEAARAVPHQAGSGLPRTAKPRRAQVIASAATSSGSLRRPVVGFV